MPAAAAVVAAPVLKLCEAKLARWKPACASKWQSALFSETCNNGENLPALKSDNVLLV